MKYKFFKPITVNILANFSWVTVLGVLRFLKNTRPSLETFWTFPDPSFRMCFAWHNSVTSAFWKSENWGKFAFIYMNFSKVCHLSLQYLKCFSWMWEIWSVGVSKHDIEVFNGSAGVDSHLRRNSWQVHVKMHSRAKKVPVVILFCPTTCLFWLSVEKSS